MKRKTPISVRIINSKSSGDMHITDAYAVAYKKSDVSTSVTEVKTERPDIYMTQNSIIVYGDIASLRIYSMDGRMVSRSDNMQVIETSHLAKGNYILTVTSKDGSRYSEKFIR